MLDGHNVRLEWSEDGETFRYRFESQEERLAEVRRVEPGVYLALAEGASYEVKADAGSVSIAGHTFSVEILDPRRWRRAGASSRGEGRQNIAAPMPGKVVRVLVAEGDQVEAGQGLVVVEAMKMQNEIKATRSGRVVALTAAAGSTVNAGDILVAIE